MVGFWREIDQSNKTMLSCLPFWGQVGVKAGSRFMHSHHLVSSYHHMPHCSESAIKWCTTRLNLFSVGFSSVIPPSGHPLSQLRKVLTFFWSQSSHVWLNFDLGLSRQLIVGVSKGVFSHQGSHLLPFPNLVITKWMKECEYSLEFTLKDSIMFFSTYIIIPRLLGGPAMIDSEKFKNTISKHLLHHQQTRFSTL